jgi:hypothetical protein
LKNRKSAQKQLDEQAMTQHFASTQVFIGQINQDKKGNYVETRKETGDPEICFPHGVREDIGYNAADAGR